MSEPLLRKLLYAGGSGLQILAAVGLAAIFAECGLPPLAAIVTAAAAIFAFDRAMQWLYDQAEGE